MQALSFDAFFTSTITFEVHNFPGDYYRFSEQAFRDVFFDAMIGVEISCVIDHRELSGQA